MNLVINGLLLGLSTGIFCLAYCLPIFAPIIMTGEGTTKKNFSTLIKFNLGRLLGYLLFGALVGWLGLTVKNPLIHKIAWLALLFLAILMIFYSLGILRPRAWFCQYLKKIKTTWLFGFLIGLNICPPFLIALSYGFNLKNVLSGMIFFTFFFIGSSLFMIPPTFLGYLARYQFWRQVAMVAGFLVGVIFLILGLVNLISNKPWTGRIFF